MNVKQIAEFVKIEHTLFSLPFVLIGYFLAIEQIGADVASICCGFSSQP